MEHIQNIPPAAATHEPAVPSITPMPDPAAAPPAPGCIVLPHPASLTDPLIHSALDAGCPAGSDHPARHDGWTPDRITVFLRELAATACVSRSARAAGITRQAAYQLRASTKGRAFALAWDAAVRISRSRLAADLLSRALGGNVETVYRDGRVVEQRHHHDNMLGLALLSRFDRLAENNDGGNATRFIEEEFDQFVAIAAAGGEGAADFVAARRRLGCRGQDEDQVLERAENFAATGDGLPEGYEAEESPTANLIRSLFAAATDEDDDEYEDEDEYDDEDDYDHDDEDGEEPGREGPGEAEPDFAVAGDPGLETRRSPR